MTRRLCNDFPRPLHRISWYLPNSQFLLVWLREANPCRLYYCSITNCSSPLRDCDTPDECSISSPCLKACDKPPISSRATIFSADRLCILGGFENGECQRMKINSTRVEKSKILAKLPNLDVCHILDLSSVMLVTRDMVHISARQIPL